MPLALRPLLGFVSVAATTSLASGPAAATATMEGTVSADYVVQSVGPHGHEQVAAWFEVDAVQNHYPGPLDSPPLALVLRLKRDHGPGSWGEDVAWLPIGRLAPGERLTDIDGWVWAFDAIAGDYVAELRLVEDTRDARLQDAHELQPDLRWRGGIDLRGPMRIDFDGYGGIRARFESIRNRRFDGYSGDLKLTLYRTHDTGPAAAGEFVCDRYLPGLYAGESVHQAEMFCDDVHGDPHPWTYHLSIAPAGESDGDTLSESRPEHAPIVAGASVPSTLLTLLLLAAIRRACAPRATDSRMRALPRARSSVG